MKRIMMLLVACFFLLNIYGCWLIVAGAAGGSGTAAWLSGKLSQRVNASYDRTINAVKSALKSLKMEVSKESKSKSVTQIKSIYSDGREIWIDIRPISESTTKVEVRVGVLGDKTASDKILKEIAGRL